MGPKIRNLTSTRSPTFFRIFISCISGYPLVKHFHKHPSRQTLRYRGFDEVQLTYLQSFLQARVPNSTPVIVIAQAEGRREKEKKVSAAYKFVRRGRLKFKCWRQLNAILFLATVRCQRFLTKEKSPRKHPKLADIAH